MTSAAADPPVGAVLVVGGGIAGMQASLDLADSGFKVFLVEKESAIGGRMAQIDKTFPTNDCSMCIVSPKLVDVGRHENIEILTGTELEALEGTCGHFRATLVTQPRFVKLGSCTGCGECVERCPVVVPDQHNFGMSRRHAIHKKYPQAIPGAFTIQKRGTSPCRLACPAGVNAHAYVRLIAAGRFAEALAVERQRNPFPAVCGRICPHPCEMECSRGRLDAPIAIAHLKRFLADWEMADPARRPPPPEIHDRPERVAIIGGGPAGLTAARNLRLAGYQVTLFESRSSLGGMLHFGVPDYRLPSELVDFEIRTEVLDLGVEVRLETALGKDVSIDELRRQGFAAILLAVGAHQGLKLRVPGEKETTEGLYDAVDLLGRVNQGEDVGLHGRVFVVGGGNVAMDAARVALRLGASEVTVLYRRAREQMPASPWEIEEAEEEGVRLQLLCNPVEVKHDAGRLIEIRCVRMELGEPDESGRRRPVPVEGSELALEADFLITAIGQRPAVEPFQRDVEALLGKRGTFEVDPLTLQTSSPDLFAAGDAVLGPATAIEAIHAGSRAAESIIRLLTGQDLRAGRELPEPTVARPELEGLPQRPRTPIGHLSSEVRTSSFQEVTLGFTEEEAVAEAGRCLDCAGCCECLLCEGACKAEAIDHQDVVTTREISVGSVILAPGFETFKTELRAELGHGRYANVVTSIELERLLSASGPTEGHVKRPGDGTEPRRVAWIQCVGSRDHACNRGYCSSVCCMYATKQAVIAKEHDASIEPTIFYMDLRAHGKGFDDYVTRAREHYGVRYVRSMVSRVFEDPVTGDLELRYMNGEGQRVAETFDLVVLSVGLQISSETQDLARRLRVSLDPQGFALTETFKPLATDRQGVFVCGVFSGPKDIPETVSEASGAAGAAGTVLAEARGTLVASEELPPERVATEGEDLRIGVFVCHCGINIAAIVDVEEVAVHARRLPGVVHADTFLYTCSEDSQRRIKELIAEHQLNRVVVASCSPRTHEPLFQLTLRQVGLNKYLFDMANIRDQCSWVHRHDHHLATEKAKRLLRMAVASVSAARPLIEREIPVTPGLLVVGGGLAGMTAALEAAHHGFRVHLVEKEAQLGGNLRKLRETFAGEPIGAFLEDLVGQVTSESLIQVHTGSQVVGHRGYVGNFETEIMTPPGASRTLRHGALLLATGGREVRPTLYGLGSSGRVMTQTDFEQRLHGEAGLGSDEPHVVMIQCVGSRDEQQPYCSRVCCNQAIKNALAFGRRFPGGRVDVLYRDVRSYGLGELSFRRARREGTNFIRYDPDGNEPTVEFEEGTLSVTVRDESVRARVTLRPDLLVLSTGIAAESCEELGSMLRVPRASTGFFIEAHAKLRPVDFASEGMFLAGLAHGPKSIPETITQALAAVARAATVLSRSTMRLSGVVSEVNPDRCAACLTCVRACPYGVPVISEDHRARINPALCQGCGICVAECPAKTIVLGNYRDEQILGKLTAMPDRRHGTGARKEA